MYKALKSPQSVIWAHRPLSFCTILLSAIVLTAAPAAAEELRMDHENVTVEPIEDRGASPERAAEVPSGAFEPVYEDKAPAVSAEPAVHETEAAPPANPEISPEPAAVEAQPALNETKPEGPEIYSQPAAEPAAEPFFPSQPGRNPVEAAPEVAQEPAGVDPLMEAAQAHDSASDGTIDNAQDGNSGSQPAENAAEAAPAVAPAAAQAAAPVAGEPGDKPVEVAAVAPDKKVDIFDQWAHSKFASRKEKAPHPLAAEHPDDFVVVCEAGCAGGPVEIVYMERRDARGPVNEKPLKDGLVASTSAIDCVGGCYQGHNAYSAVAVTWDPSAIVTETAASDNGWMTTVKKTAPEADDKKKANSSGRWYDRIN